MPLNLKKKKKLPLMTGVLRMNLHKFEIRVSIKKEPRIGFRVLVERRDARGFVVGDLMEKCDVKNLNREKREREKFSLPSKLRTVTIFRMKLVNGYHKGPIK